MKNSNICEHCGSYIGSNPTSLSGFAVGYGYWGQNPEAYPKLEVGVTYFISSSHRPQDGTDIYVGLPFKVLDEGRIQESTGSFTKWHTILPSDSDKPWGLMLRTDDKVFNVETNEQVPIPEQPRINQDWLNGGSLWQVWGGKLR